MPNLQEITQFLDSFLATHRYPETERGGIYYPSPHPIQRLGLALEASPHLDNWVKTKRLDAMFLHRPWNLQSSSVGVLSYHLPFDERLTLGFNPRLAQVLSLANLEVLGEKEGRSIGMIGDVPCQDFLSYQTCIQSIFGGQDKIHSGTKAIQRVAVVGAMTDALVREAAHRGANIYITGQWRQPGEPAILETGLGAIAVGHRRCELWGLRSLAGILRERWSTLTVFLQN